MIYIAITKSDGWYVIKGRGTLDGVSRRYLYHSKREAIKRFRQEFNLVGKKLEIIEY